VPKHLKLTHQGNMAMLQMLFCQRQLA